jgi:hypothetical protein
MNIQTSHISRLVFFIFQSPIPPKIDETTKNPTQTTKLNVETTKALSEATNAAPQTTKAANETTKAPLKLFVPPQKR